MLRGLIKNFSKKQISVYIAEIHPLRAVVRGTGMALKKSIKSTAIIITQLNLLYLSVYWNLEFDF
jgi:hypothetical protein